MPQHPYTLLLHGGGMQSLVATAMHAELRLAVLFIHDGRPNSEHRHASFEQVAEQYHVAKRHEIVMPHLAASGATLDVTQPVGRSAMADVQILSAAVGVATQLKADRIIWPHQVGAKFAEVARVTESLMLLSQILRLEAGRELPIDTPLLDMNDKQLVEVGHQLSVPWQMSRSCDTPRHDPCGECYGCRRRHDAFRAAGIEDPLFAHSY
jgi:7-cyano-7-deazaguanine synthase